MKTYYLLKSIQKILNAFKAAPSYKYSIKLSEDESIPEKHHIDKKGKDDNDPFFHESNPMLFPGGPLN